MNLLLGAAGAVVQRAPHVALLLLFLLLLLLWTALFCSLVLHVVAC